MCGILYRFVLYTMGDNIMKFLLQSNSSSQRYPRERYGRFIETLKICNNILLIMTFIMKIRC